MIVLKSLFKPESREQKQAQGLVSSLERLLSPEQVSLRWPDRLVYGRDSNSKGILWARQGQVPYPPHCVAWPHSTAEVAQVLAFANESGVPVVPFGGGSGVCGGTWALKGGIALDLKRLDRIHEIDSRRMRVRAQTGISGEIFERALAKKGLTLGHFPSSIYAATLGGYLACRSAGQFSSLYGKIEDMVQEIEVVLANGEIFRIGSVGNRPKILDLKEAFVGSEGTLGVITEATLRIHPQPEEEYFIGLEFPSLEKGFQGIREILQRGLRPALMRLYDPLDTLLATSYKKGEQSGGEPTFSGLSELFDPLLKKAKGLSLKLALRQPALLQQVTDLLGGRCLLILGFRGLRSVIQGRLLEAIELCGDLGAKNLGEGPGRYWLKHRYSVSYKLSPYFDQGFFADTLETAITWDKLLPLYHGVRKAIGRHAIVLAHFSHAYAEGCSIYFTFLGYRDSEAESLKLYDRIWHDALGACVSVGGTVSHHHGVGLLKAEYMKNEWGESFEWLSQLKKTLDPQGILNPGKLGFS